MAFSIGRNQKKQKNYRAYLEKLVIKSGQAE